jgi:spore coat protein U-like protein
MHGHLLTMPPFMRAIVLNVALAFALLCLAQPAKAQMTCSFLPYSPESFGTINTTSGASYSVSSYVGVGCTGGSVGQQMIECVQIVSSSNGSGGSNGPLYMASGSNILNYYAYKDAAHTQIWPLGTWVAVSFTLDSTGGGQAIDNPQLLVPAGQTLVPSGSYSTSLSLNMKVGTSASLGTGCTGSYVLSQAASVTITATNSSTCTVSGTSLSFGSISALSSNVDAQTAISLTCSNKTAWTLSLDGGQNGGTSATSRKMVNGANSVTYGLFSDAARSQGLYGSSNVTGTGTGAAQSVTVYGRVAPQTTPPAATYTDTVVMSVSY